MMTQYRKGHRERKLICLQSDAQARIKKMIKKNVFIYRVKTIKVWHWDLMPRHIREACKARWGKLLSAAIFLSSQADNGDENDGDEDDCDEDNCYDDNDEDDCFEIHGA